MKRENSDYFTKVGMLPEHMRGGIIRYIERGVPPGDFLRLVLCNDLMGCVGRADLENQRALIAWCSYLYNYAPMTCRGGKDQYEAWVKSGGLVGQGYLAAEDAPPVSY